MRHTYEIGAWLVLTGALLGATGCIASPDVSPTNHPLQQHSLVPLSDFTTGQIAAGEVTGESLDQPIAFTHKRHVEVLGMQCEFCHAEARRSIHGGVPPTQTCANCHSMVAKVKDKPEVQRVMDYCGWDAATKRCTKPDPIPWNKVHDLPDYVRFSHQRHVKAGVDCTECHGQVGQMEGTRVTVTDPHTGEQVERVEGVMIREATLQMGWCLDCHASHPSIRTNYCGDTADSGEDCDASNIRRAELKDCWTCHK